MIGSDSADDCSFGCSFGCGLQVGEAEKLVRALFVVAREREPAIIFIDEIDSVLSARSSNENESSRRLKTEFLIQFDGVSKGGSGHGGGGGQVFVIGASNRPEELDDAVRRRLAKRIHVPLPDGAGREQILHNLLGGQKVRIARDEFARLVRATDGYSASDIKELCHEAAMEAIRELPVEKLATVHVSWLHTHTHTHTLSFLRETLLDRRGPRKGFKLWKENATPGGMAKRDRQTLADFYL